MALSCEKDRKWLQYNLYPKVAAMLIIDIEIDTIIHNFNVNSEATKCLSKVAWDSYLVRYRRVSFRLTDYLELIRGSTYVSSKNQGILILHG